MGPSWFLILINIAIFIGAALLINPMFKRRHKPAIRWLLLLVVSYCLISFSVLNVYSNIDFESRVFFSRLRFIGLAILAPTWLLFISANFKSWMWLQKGWVQLFVFGPSFVTIFFTLIPGFRNWVITDFKPIQVGDLSVLQFSSGLWFPFHYSSSLVLVFASLTLGFSIFLKGDFDQRRQIILLMAGTILAIGIDLYCVITNSPLRWVMLSGGTFLFNQGAIAYSVFRHQLLEPSALAMEKVYLDFPDPVIVVDSHEKICSFNRAAESLFGLSEASLFISIEVAIPSLSLIPGDCSLVSDSGEKKFFELKIENLGSEHRSVGRLFFFREVTGRKQTEMRLGQQLDFKARLMAVLAHDLSGNTQAQARLIQELQQGVPTEMQEAAAILADSITSSKDLMSNLMAWAKTQESSFKPLVCPYEINALIEDSIGAVQSLADIKGVQLRFASHKAPLVVEGDSEMIASVVRNILTNSIRASSLGQEVRIQLGLEGDGTLKVQFEDFGTGLSSDQLQRILSATQSLSSYQGAKGYGIGLSVARRFLEIHGGHLEIESSVGKGTRVSFGLPLHVRARF